MAGAFCGTARHPSRRARLERVGGYASMASRGEVPTQGGLTCRIPLQERDRRHKQRVLGRFRLNAFTRRTPRPSVHVDGEAEARHDVIVRSQTRLERRGQSLCNRGVRGGGPAQRRCGRSPHQTREACWRSSARYAAAALSVDRTTGRDLTGAASVRMRSGVEPPTSASAATTRPSTQTGAATAEVRAATPRARTRRRRARRRRCARPGRRGARSCGV